MPEAIPPPPPVPKSEPPALKLWRAIFKTAIDIIAVLVIHDLALKQKWPPEYTMAAVGAIVGVWGLSAWRGRATPRYPAALWPLIVAYKAPRLLAAIAAAAHRHGA